MITETATVRHSSSSTMNLVTVISLLVSILVVRAQNCEEDLPPCSDVHDVAKITCPGDGSDCSITNQDTQGDLLGDPAITEITAAECKAKCMEQADGEYPEPKCKIYRWVTERSGKSYCSLQTTCGGADPWCDESNSRCETGQVGCTDDGEPDPIPCSLKTPTEWHSKNVHVICLGPRGEEVDIYNSDMIDVIPGGTFCKTMRKCAAWADVVDQREQYYRRLAVVCDRSNGLWKSEENTGSTAASGAMIVDETIVEPTCPTLDEPCPDLMLTHTDEVGVDLICENSLGADNILKDGNSCILLCNNDVVMEIECGLSWDGDKTWIDDNRDVVTDDRVKCYDG